jgi:hypothetical protein
MAAEERETTDEWSLVGIEKDDEFIPANDHGGGVDTFTTGPVGPPDPPED